MMISLHLKAGLALTTALAGMALGTTPANAQIITDFLLPGETGIYDEEPLGAGESFIITCDSDCDDIDAWLYDAYSDELIDSDTANDAAPIVTTEYSGTFRLEVYMADCDAPFCAIYVE
jgi:hypothetical protein